MQMSRQPYPSDITRKQFERIRPLLEGARSSTRPREIDLYDVFCAVLYLLKTGCPCRALPRDFPSWQSIYAYFRIWQEADENGTSLLERALKNQVAAARVRFKRNAAPSFLIVDAQSVKNSETAGSKGYDAGKKVSGIKRHLAVDTQGFLHAVAITTAEISDRKGAEVAFERCAEQL
jgi:transposase